MGDFNQILSSEEGFALISNVASLQGMEDFRSCFNISKLFDLSFRGCRFTWSNNSLLQPKASKLDRALVNERWHDTFLDSYALFDAPGSSDHSPCLVSLTQQVERRNYRFTYFTFYSSHPEFKISLQSVWENPILVSSPMFSLYQRLKATKIMCKSLNRTSFSGIQIRAKEAFTTLEELQKRVLSNPSPELYEEERRARDSWLFFAAAEESFYRQKSRIRWLKEGDASIGYFHKSMTTNLSRNVVHFLREDRDVKIYNSDELKRMVTQYYYKLLGETNVLVQPPTISYIQQIHSYMCDSSTSLILQAIPSEEEIRRNVFALPLSKAPNPDEFSAEFFTSNWEIVGSDLIKAVKDFFLHPSMLRQVNATVISLIPKFSGASKLSDFRPISLCNTVYKVISRILASRLQRITPLTVQRNQVGFINGRLMCEKVLLATELVADFHTSPVTRSCLQIDISKAYDSVHWASL